MLRSENPSRRPVARKTLHRGDPFDASTPVEGRIVHWEDVGSKQATGQPPERGSRRPAGEVTDRPTRRNLFVQTFPRVLAGILPFAILSLLLSPRNLPAEAITGLEVATRAWNNDRGFGDFSANIVLTTTKKDGKKIIRRLRTRTVETPEGDKSISVFDFPHDVKGFARLTYAHEDGNDDQWLYIPDRKRVKRISSVNAGTPFMGTEYAFEDLGSQRPEEIGSFTYKLLGTEPCSDRNVTFNCYVIERIPNNPYTGYSKQVAWIDDSGYRTLKVEYYDKKGELLKTQTLSNYFLFYDKHWRPGTMLMRNHQNGNSTLVEWSQYQFKNGFNPSNFSPGKLKNAR